MNNTQSRDDEVDCANVYSYLEEFTYFLNTYYKIFVIIFGILGNSICIFIFWRSKLAHSNRTSFYLISLATSDIAFLLTLLFQYLDETRFFITISRFALICKTLTYLGFVINFLSCSLILTLTVQRLCSICFPLKFFNTKIESRSKLIVGSLILIGLVLYFYLFYIYDVKNISIKNNTIELACLPQYGYEKSAEVLMFVDSIITLVIPFFAILTMNIIIIRTIKNSSYNFIIRTSSIRSHNGMVAPNNNKNNLCKQASDNSGNYNNKMINHSNNNLNRMSKQLSDDQKSVDNNSLFKQDSIIYYNNNSNNNNNNNSSNLEDKVQIRVGKKKSRPNRHKTSSTTGKFNRLKNRSAFSSIDSLIDHEIKYDRNSVNIQIKNSNSANSNNSKQEETSKATSSLIREIKRKRFLKKSEPIDEDIESRKISPFETNYKRKSTSSPTQLLIQIPKKKLNKFNSLFKSTESQTLSGRTRMSFRISGPRTNSVSAKISKMLIFVSTTFLLLNLPTHSFNIYIFITRRFFGENEYSCIENYLHCIFNNLFFSAFSCNFLLYSISGVSFRNEFKRIVFKLLRIKNKKI